jgi:hypothetical protein
VYTASPAFHYWALPIGAVTVLGLGFLMEN